ncbi:hypothetical protein [Escherichia coli]|uniref:hypothetical protein n=1 Tax=Escherichia coli TaxID=562 RepID=UPI001BFEA01B|nr:hypothetical protein [Escherichia coli]
MLTRRKSIRVPEVNDQDGNGKADAAEVAAEVQKAADRSGGQGCEERWPAALQS